MTGMQNPTSRAIHTPENVTIANSGTESTTINLSRAAWGSFSLPSGFNGTEVTIEGSVNGTTWNTVRAEGNETNPMTVAANKPYDLPVKTFCFQYARIVATTAQTGEASIEIFLRG